MRAICGTLTLAAVAVADYCPQEKDINTDYTSGDESRLNFENGGWSITGGARVSSKSAFNLLGGWVSFTMDLTGMKPAVNSNFYTVSPNQENCGKSCYCDAQGAGGGCMEMDIIEANGNAAWATTWHTTDAGGTCDAGGCQAIGHFANGGCGSSSIDKNKPFLVNTSFSDDGNMNVVLSQGGASMTMNGYNPSAQQQDRNAVSQQMKSRGAVIESSQWTGWVPGNCASGGSLQQSTFKVSDFRVHGSVVKGPEPAHCGDPVPAPTPSPPTPAPEPCPDEGSCGCSWTDGGKNCGSDDASECWCRCCCQYKHSCKWKHVSNTTK